jgi:hypothetical protein
MHATSRYFQRFLSLAPSFGLVAILCCLSNGCGGNSPAAPVSAMNGNFSISATSSVTLEVNTFNGGIQTDSAGHVTGILHVQGLLFDCFGLEIDLPLSGTIDSAGHLNATITGSGNQTITLNATVSPDGTSISDGSYSGNGTAGCAGGDHGAIAGFQVQAFTGTYSGSFSPSPSTTITLALPLVQSSTVGSHGTFPVSASTVTVTGGAACGFSSATLVPAGSAASGDDLGLILLGSDNFSLMIFAGTATNGNTSVVQGVAIIDTGACSGQVTSLTLSRP